MYRSEHKLTALLVLSIRILLALIFIHYGIGKLSGGQFGRLSDAEQNTPIKELSLFKIGWYLFDHQPFKAFIGISQLVASVLLLFNRTVILGLLMLIPIILNILIIDLTIMNYGFKVAFFFRLTGYLFYIALLLFYYKQATFPAFRCITPTSLPPHRLSNKWGYLWILLIIPLLEVATSIPKMLFMLAKHPKEVWAQVMHLFTS
ncbi:MULTISPECIES: DoxX family membrane protein [Sphingobacterium]|uniref:DoxX family membrane protein n=1 Tax=Sphingobacterium TaxID=28453 RepID=UPI002244F209|nr:MULTISPECIES: DoxX family membrane protein [Sphingobacterium]MCW8310203.1 DoxX family membrane protein [Sphingobacterium sp. InxBP1]